MKDYCVICKHGILAANAGREDTKYKQWCSSCGDFKICHKAVLILDAAVKEGRRTRKEVVDHFSKIIKAENRLGRMAIITSDDAQAFGFGNFTPGP